MSISAKNKILFLTESLFFSIIGWIVFLVAGAVALGRLPGIQDFVHFDSVHYISIAERGYELFPCTPDIGLIGTWCGNTAWQPLYPILMRILSVTALPLEVSGLVITAVAGFLLLYFISTKLVGKHRRWRYLVLFCAAAYPGATWSHAIFPMSLVLLFGFLAIQQAYSGSKYWLTGVYLTLAILSHSSGFVIAVAAIAALALQTPLFKIQKYLLLAIPLLIGLSLWLVGLSLFTGRWDAWWLVQQKYYSQGQELLSKLYGPIFHLLDIRKIENEALFWPSLQTWIVLSIILVMAIYYWRNRTKWLLLFRDFFVLFMLGLFPFVLGGQLSISRNESQIIDARAYIPVGTKLYAVFAFAFVITYFGISKMYFLNAIA